MTPGRKDPPGRDSMLDLPLRDGQRQADLGYKPDALRTRRVTPAGKRPPAPPPRRRRGRRSWLLVLVVLLLLALLGAWLLWPKPPTPEFSQSPFVLEKVRVGGEGEPEALTITNIGERPMPVVEVRLIETSNDEFRVAGESCAGTTLAPQQSCVVQVRFSPAAMGERSAVLELEAEMPRSPAQLRIHATGIAPLMRLMPSTIQFGPHDVGQLAPAQQVAVVNDGTAPMTIHRVVLSGVAEADFRLTANECSKSTLEPGQSCGLSVAFAARAAGAREAEIAVDSDAIEPQPVVQLTGEGIWTGAAFEVQPGAVDFGSHLVGTPRRRARLQVVNRRSGTLGNLRLRLEDAVESFGLASNGCQGATLAPGGSCAVELWFAAPQEGAYRGLLEITQADAGTLGVDLAGRGVAPRWVLAEASIDFGRVRVGQKSTSRAFALRNEGTAGAKITELEVEGADSEAFRLSSDRCSGRDVGPKEGCSVDLGFRPRREGEHRARLHVKTEAGSDPPRIDLQAVAVASRLRLDRELLSFGEVHRTTQRRVQLVLANPGTAALRLARLSVSGENASDFELVGGSCRGLEVVPAGGNCGLVVAFTPSREGRETGRLVIDHDGLSGPSGLPMAGIGLPPPIPEIFLETEVVDFGPQPVGSRTSIQTVRLRAGGTGNLELRDFSVEGEHAADFFIVPATCDAAPVLQPGSDCTIGVRFLPSAVGRRSARLVIRHNAGSGISSIPLTGEGLGAPSG